MIDEISRLLDSHWKWLKDKTQLRSLGDQWVEITTPYLDRHNDMLQIYAKRANNGYVLTDDGYVINDLLHSGCKLDSAKRQSLLNMTLGGFGIQNNEGCLEVHSTEESFALRKHSLIQAMLAVNDLFFLSVPMVGSLFYEDVMEWLDRNDVRYTPNVKFTGKSGFDHLFEFVIPKSKKQPERIMQTINRPSRDTAEAFAFKREVRVESWKIRPKRNVSFIPANLSRNRTGQGASWKATPVFTSVLSTIATTKLQGPAPRNAMLTTEQT